MKFNIKVNRISFSLSLLLLIGLALFGFQNCSKRLFVTNAHVSEDNEFSLNVITKGSPTFSIENISANSLAFATFAIPNPISTSPATNQTKGQTQFHFPITVDPSVDLNAVRVSLNGSSNGCTYSPNPIPRSGEILISGCSDEGPLSITLTLFKGDKIESTVSSSSVVLQPNSIDISGVSSKTYYYKDSVTHSDPLNDPYSFVVYYPSNYLNQLNPAFVFIHGGGWFWMNNRSEETMLKSIAAKGFIVISLNYTLKDFSNLQNVRLNGAPPENCSSNPDPKQNCTAKSKYQAPSDIEQALIYFNNTLFKNANTFNIDPTQISIGGVSGGALLALIQSTNLNDPTNYLCVFDGFGPTDLVLGVEQVTGLAPTFIGNFPFPSIDLIRGVWGEDSFLKESSPAIKASNFKGKNLIVMHSETDSLIPVEQATWLLKQIQLSKPSTDTTFLTWHGGKSQSSNEYNGADHNLAGIEYNLAIPTLLNTKCKKSKVTTNNPTTPTPNAATLNVTCAKMGDKNPSVTCSATASGIVSGDWYVNGTVYSNCKNKTSCVWNNVSNGTYTVMAMGLDAQGKGVTSNSTIVTVESKVESPIVSTPTSPAILLSCLSTSVKVGEQVSCTAKLSPNSSSSIYWLVNNDRYKSCDGMSKCSGAISKVSTNSIQVVLTTFDGKTEIAKSNIITINVR